LLNKDEDIGAIGTIFCGSYGFYFPADGSGGLGSSVQATQQTEGK
jgi:hypothetical protein